MEITEVRIKLMPGPENDPQDHLLAFALVVFDDLMAVRDFKIKRGKHSDFVTMPCRQLTIRCQSCNMPNRLKADYCDNYGVRLLKDTDKKDEFRVDIFHVIDLDFERNLKTTILTTFYQEQERAQQPDYMCIYDHCLRVLRLDPHLLDD